MKLSIGMYPTEPFQDLSIAIKLIEESGFYGIFSGDIPFGWEYNQTLQLMANLTSKIKIGLAITNPYTRHPLKTAIAAAGLHTLAPNRLIFGLGAGSQESLQSLGLDWDRPVQYLRETIQIIRTIAEGGGNPHIGPTVTAKEVALWPPAPGNFPIVIGCRRPKMLQLAGELCEGVILDNVPYNYVDYAKEQIQIGANKKNRSLSNFDYCNITSFAVDNERHNAIKKAKYLVPVDFITISQKELSCANLTFQDIQPIQDALAIQTDDAHQKAASLVTDEMVETFSVAGTPEDCIRRIKDGERAGLNHMILCIPMDPESKPYEAIKLTAEHILPAFL